MKISLLLLIALMAFSCSPESKAKSIIEKGLKKTMNDWKSYEFVEMSPMKEYYTTFIGTQEEQELYEKKFNVKKRLGLLEVYVKYPDLYTKQRYKEIVDSIPICRQNLENAEKEYKNKEKKFKGKLLGYYTKFKFRGKNKLGGLVMNSYDIYFDKDITKIVDIKDCSN
jgi:hypothetical protein